jgi:two-component system, chemotaxis family, chemotaxis protein CheY
MEKVQHQSLLEAISTPEPILVVDDDTDVLQMIQWVLEDEGFEVQTATDGQDALILARQRQPALVILDMGLPFFDGSHVAAELHTLYGTAVPIVLITADGRTAHKARQIGAAAFLRKPFEIAALLQAVQRILAER